VIWSLSPEEQQELVEAFELLYPDGQWVVVEMEVVNWMEWSESKLSRSVVDVFLLLLLLLGCLGWWWWGRPPFF
jgi:hypothetical protein